MGSLTAVTYMREKMQGNSETIYLGLGDLASGPNSANG